jgi:hypothetical protein
MNLISRSFVRKRAISLATTMTVAATSLALAHGPMAETGGGGTLPVHNLVNSSEAPFLAENEAAMTKMMTDMAVRPTGDVDRDFVEMMAPHHQGAIDMAQAVLRYGHNEQLRRLAQEIIVTQQQEIAAMRLAVGDKLPPSMASPTQPQAVQQAPVSHRTSASPDVTGMSHGIMSSGSMSHDSMNMK